MGQPSLISPTNILPFPLARAEKEDLRRHAESEGRDHRSGVIAPPAGIALERQRIQNGYLIIPLRGYDNCASRDGAPSRIQATCSSQEYSSPFNSLRPPFIVSLSVLRLLATALIFLAVLPTLSADAILWLGNADTPRFPPVHASSSHGATTKAEVIITLPAISMPATFRAIAGENTPFPIVIDGTYPVEGGDTIAISRLPAGSTFSAGVPQGETAWRLRSGDIKNLRLALPKAARGERALMIQLLAPNGHVISDAATIVQVTAVSEARIPIRRVKTEIIPGDVWDQSGQQPEAMDAEAEVVSQTAALQSDPIPLPARRPGPRR